jgi:hypothetical protein
MERIDAMIDTVTLGKDRESRVSMCRPGNVWLPLATLVLGLLSTHLFAQNSAADQPGEPGEPDTFTSNSDAAETDTEAQNGRGTIFIRYLGDTGGCRVNIAIRLQENDRLITLTGSVNPVEDLLLVGDHYTIVGSIQCPLWGTSCTATGDGEIELRDGVTFDIAWSNAGVASCAVSLASMGE